MKGNIDEKIRALPKVELHRHLEGCITAEMLLKIAQEHGIKLPTMDLERLRSYVQIQEKTAGLKEFLDKFYWLAMAFPDLETIERIAYEVARDCSRDNIRYVELRFSPTFMSLEKHHDWGDLLLHLLKGVRRAEEDFPIEVGLIVAVSRSNSLTSAMQTVAIASEYAGLGVVGLDLVGEERGFPPELFSSVFKIARESRLNLTIHAGEEGGESNIRAAIEELGAQRIGHGIQVVKDTSLMSFVREKGIPFEIALTSNVQTRAVSSLREHPVRTIRDFGIRVSLNTDDPAVSSTSLSREYLLAMEHFDFTIADLKSMILDTLEQAFIEEYRKVKLRARLRDELALID